jgi:MarR family transcriptional regulator, organic hydroperoxide resistance regulator
MNHCDHIPDPPPEPSEAFDPIASQAFQAFGRAFHMHRQAMIRRFAGPETHHHGEVFALRLLAHKDGISQRELAETLHLSRSRITSILQGMERDGIVRREADAADHRVTRVFLTAEGREREMQQRAEFEEYLNKTIGALSDHDKQELARILDEVSGHIAALVGAGTKETEGRGM